MLNDYAILYREAKLTPESCSAVNARVALILINKSKYGLVAKDVQVPWWCIGAIHSLESSLNFNCHLHNGDPLSARTIHIPIGRPVSPPKAGKLPYTWVESATDALRPTWRPSDWSLQGCLEFLERYNGLGYRKVKINSPYIWGATSQYSKGLFVKDGKFDPEAKAKSIGAAAIFKVLEGRSEIQLLS